MDYCTALPLGTIAYSEAWEVQKHLHGQVAEGLLPPLLLLVEHPPVYTLGRRGKDDHVLASASMLSRLGVEVCYTDRGGEATYHGPGQLVAYPILDLKAKSMGPLEYVRSLESAIIATLAEFGIRGRSDGKPTGVWSGDAKIAAIGVKISRGVTMHGLALNVAPDLSYFEHIVPCGVVGGPVTSMASLLSREVDVADVAPVLARQLAKTFDYEMRWAALGEVGDRLCLRPA